MTWGTKNMPPKKNLSRGCLSNWCDADADADADADVDAVDADAEIRKTICRPPPYGGVDINSEMVLILLHKQFPCRREAAVANKVH